MKINTPESVRFTHEGREYMVRAAATGDAAYLHVFEPMDGHAMFYTDQRGALWGIPESGRGYEKYGDYHEWTGAVRERAIGIALAAAGRFGLSPLQIVLDPGAVSSFVVEPLGSGAPPRYYDTRGKYHQGPGLGAQLARTIHAGERTFYAGTACRVIGWYYDGKALVSIGPGVAGTLGTSDLRRGAGWSPAQTLLWDSLPARSLKFAGEE